jgi:SHS2 domain-containing protein
MIPYELLEHTADAKFRAYGENRQEVFANAVQGMTAIIADPAQLDRSIVLNIGVKASTMQGLLFDLLDELLFLHDTQNFIAACAENLTIIERDGKFILDATLRGDEATKWPGNLKAVTYSEMLVHEQPDGTWVIQAVIDI